MTTINLCDNHEPLTMTGLHLKTILIINWDKNVFKPIPVNGFVIMLCYHI